MTRSFTDSDRHSFLDDSFAYIANLFENSPEELTNRNPEISFKRLSDVRFIANVYRNGQSVSECCVRQDSMLGQSITYSTRHS